MRARPSGRPFRSWSAASRSRRRPSATSGTCAARSAAAAGGRAPWTRPASTGFSHPQMPMKRLVDAGRWVTIAVAVAAGAGSSRAEEAGQPGPPSPQAAELLGQLSSEDAYTRQLAFLKLEALREPATAPAIA